MTGVEPGRVLWITGLSGAGKSTIAREVVTQLRETGQQAVLLDGDEFRAVIADPHVRHDPESRLANAMRICRMTHLLSSQGFDVVVATMSLFREIHAWNRTNLSRYCEILIDADLETLKQRDAKGHYRRAENGEDHHVVGVHLKFDLPEHPDLILKNDQSTTDFRSLARLILDRVVTRR